MRRRRPPRNEKLGSLDSLLDTMTSVVGILLIILVVLQLDVKSAVERIVRSQTKSGPKIEQKDLDAKARELEASRARFDELTRKRLAQQEAATHLETQLKIREAKLATLQSTLQRTETPQTTEQLKAQHEKLTLELKTLEKAIADAGVRYRDLRQLLAQVPDPPKVMPTDISIPEPRPAPKDAKPIRIICRDGYLFSIDEEDLRKIVTEAVKKSGSKQNAQQEYDPGPIISYFTKNDVGDKTFRLEAIEAGHKVMQFRLHRRRTGGVPGAQISNFNAPYRADLRKIDPEKNYLMFMVWPESFQTYSAARSYADKRQIPAGWEPHDEKDEYTSYLGWYITVGRKAREAEDAAKNAGKPAPPPGPPKNILD